MTTLPNLTLVLGGARSGKSDFAERLVSTTNRPRAYIATGQAFDKEMEDRIAKHRQSRGPSWHTIEAPLDISAALTKIEPGSVVLIDCLTLWINNQMMAGADVEAETDNLLHSLAKTTSPVVCVSNEVGLGLVPETELGRTFRDLQGTVNQKFAQHADLAVFVAAGLPLVLKGQLPDGVL